MFHPRPSSAISNSISKSSSKMEFDPKDSEMLSSFECVISGKYDGSTSEGGDPSDSGGLFDKNYLLQLFFTFERAGMFEAGRSRYGNILKFKSVDMEFTAHHGKPKEGGKSAFNNYRLESNGINRRFDLSSNDITRDGAVAGVDPGAPLNMRRRKILEEEPHKPLSEEFSTNLDLIMKGLKSNSQEEPQPKPIPILGSRTSTDFTSNLWDVELPKEELFNTNVVNSEKSFLEKLLEKSFSQEKEPQPTHKPLTPQYPREVHDSSIMGILIDNLTWQYMDNQNNVHGPFASKQMCQWYLNDFFPPSLLMRYNTQMPWTPFSTLYPADSKPFIDLPVTLMGNLPSCNITKQSSDIGLEEIQFPSPLFTRSKSYPLPPSPIEREDFGKSTIGEMGSTSESLGMQEDANFSEILKNSLQRQGHYLQNANMLPMLKSPSCEQLGKPVRGARTREGMGQPKQKPKPKQKEKPADCTIENTKVMKVVMDRVNELIKGTHLESKKDQLVATIRDKVKELVIKVNTPGTPGSINGSNKLAGKKSGSSQLMDLDPSRLLGSPMVNVPSPTSTQLMNQLTAASPRLSQMASGPIAHVPSPSVSLPSPLVKMPSSPTQFVGHFDGGQKQEAPSDKKWNKPIDLKVDSLFEIMELEKKKSAELASTKVEETPPKQQTPVGWQFVQEGLGGVAVEDELEEFPTLGAIQKERRPSSPQIYSSMSGTKQSTVPLKVFMQQQRKPIRRVNPNETYASKL